MNLYELTNDYQDMFNAMQSQGIEPEIIEDTLASYGDDIDSKIENVAKYRENLLATAQCKKDLAKKLNNEVKSLENQAQSMYDYIDTSMKKVGKDSIKFDYFNISYAKNPPSVNITDIQKLPCEFVTEETVSKVDKNGLKGYLKENDCEGAELTQSTRMVIK